LRQLRLEVGVLLIQIREHRGLGVAGTGDLIELILVRLRLRASALSVGVGLTGLLGKLIGPQFHCVVSFLGNAAGERKGESG
jgi:hypothetical protein